MRLIDKDLAIRILSGDVLGTSEQTHEAIKMAIKALDAEPVVRCKDCRYFVENGACICKDGGMFEPNIDDYCSYGEVKKNETN